MLCPNYFRHLHEVRAGHEMHDGEAVPYVVHPDFARRRRPVTSRGVACSPAATRAVAPPIERARVDGLRPVERGRAPGCRWSAACCAVSACASSAGPQRSRWLIGAKMLLEVIAHANASRGGSGTLRRLRALYMASRYPLPLRGSFVRRPCAEQRAPVLPWANTSHVPPGPRTRSHVARCKPERHR